MEAIDNITCHFESILFAICDKVNKNGFGISNLRNYFCFNNNLQWAENSERIVIKKTQMKAFCKFDILNPQ